MKPENGSEYRGVYKVIFDVKAVTGWSMMTIAKQVHCYTTGVSVATIEKSLRQGFRKLGHSKYEPQIALAWGVSATVFLRDNLRACKTVSDLRRIYGMDVNEIIERCDRLMLEQHSHQQRLQLYWGTVRMKLTALGHQLDGMEKETLPDGEQLHRTVRMLKTAYKSEQDAE